MSFGIWVCGDEGPNLHTGLWALFDDVDTFEEEQTIREAPRWKITYEKGGRVQSKEVIFLGYDEYRSSKYLDDLSDLPRISNNKDELQACTKRIRMHKYLREKLLPPH